MYRNDSPTNINFARFLRYIPTAVAMLRGSPEYPDISGSVRFYETAYGTVIFAEAVGLPTVEGLCDSPVFGFHIHGGGSCTGNAEDPFSDAGTHYDPDGCSHPYHAGDLPPLIGAGGIAFSAFLTNRFAVDEIIGKTVIIHGSPDDFTSQPSGNAGDKIACGEIVFVRK